MKIQKVKSVLKYEKSVLNILCGGMQVDSNTIEFSNLETTVVIMKSGNTGDGYGIDAKGLYSTGDVELVDEWPKRPELGDKAISFNLSHENKTALMRSIPYLSKDPFRPVMSGVNVNSKYFAYTNGHALGHHEHGIEMNDKVNHTLNPELIALIDNSATELHIFQFYSILKTEIDGYKASVISRNIEDKYPNYLPVIPQAEDYTHYIEMSISDIKSMLTLAKRSKMPANGDMPLLDISDEFAYVPTKLGGGKKIPTQKGSIDTVDHIIMPVIVDSTDEFYDKSKFRLNLDLLARVTSKASSVRIYYYAPNRAMALQVSYCDKAPRESQLAAALRKIARLENLLTQNNIDF